MSFPSFYVDALRLDQYPFAVLRGSDTVNVEAPSTTLQVVQSLLLDGQVVVADHTENRTLVVPLLVEGGDLTQLAVNEQTLMLAAGGAKEFRLDPGDGSPSTVFDVLIGTANHVRDDDHESALVRRYDVTFVCQPWPRPQSQTTVSVTTGSSTDATLSDGSTTTSWSVPYGTLASPLAAVTYNGETALEVKMTDGSAAGGVIDTVALAWSGTVGTSSTYLWIDIITDPATHFRPESPRCGTTGTGGTLQGSLPVSVQVMKVGSNTVTRYVFLNPGGTPTFTFVVEAEFPLLRRWFYVAGMGKSTAVARQSLFTIPVGGSQRTQGSVVVTMPAASGFETVFVYGDPTMATHGWAPDVFDSWQQAPAGRYVVYAGRSGTSGPTIVSATDVTGRVTSRSTILTSSRQGYDWFPVGTFELGGARGGRVGTYTWAVTKNTVTQTVTYASSATYQILLFRVADDATLTNVRMGRGSGTRSIYLDAPALGDLTGGVFTAATTSAPIASALSITTAIVTDNTYAWEHPVLTPPSTVLWVSNSPWAAGSSSSVASVGVTYYPRFHTYVAP